MQDWDDPASGPSETASSREQVVWITGAAGGLGTALTRVFLRGGWRVAAVGHSSPPCSDPGNAHLWTGQLDVRDSAAVERVVHGIRDRWGRLDVLVCAAGAVRDRLVAHLNSTDWDAVLDVNLKGAFLCARAALKPMWEQGSGHILLIGSHAARTGPAGQSPYAAAKAGLMGLTLSLAREVGHRGICVNAVLPGLMPTAMTAGLSPRVLDGFRAASVLARLNEPEDVARWMVTLADCRHVSGQVFALDGRITRWT